MFYLRFDLLFILCGCLCGHMHISTGAHRSLKPHNSLELKLEVAVSHPSWLLEIELGSSEISVNAFNC